MNRMLPRGVTALEFLEGIGGIVSLVYSVLLTLEVMGWYTMWGAYKTIVLFYNPRTIIVTILLILEVGILSLMISYGLRTRKKWVPTISIISALKGGVIIYLNPTWIGIYLPTNHITHFFHTSLLSLRATILGFVIVVNAFLLFYCLISKEMKKFYVS